MANANPQINLFDLLKWIETYVALYEQAQTAPVGGVITVPVPFEVPAGNELWDVQIVGTRKA